MFRPFRSLVALFLVVSLFFASPSRAFDPLSLTAFVGYSLLAHGGVAGLYYYLKNKSSSVDSVGTISKDAKVQWIDAKDIQVKSKDLKASLPFSKVTAASTSKPTKYPNLKAASSKSSYPGYSDASAPPSVSYTYGVGSTVHLGSGRCVQVVELSGSPAGWNGNVDGSLSGVQDWPQYSYFEVFHPTSAHPEYPKAVWIERCYYIVKTTPTPVSVSKTPSEFKETVAPSGSVTDSAYQDELDQMMHDPDYVPTFSDATTGLPYAPPASSTVMTPAQVDAYNKTGIAKEAAATAAASAGQAATNAGNAYTASGGDLSTGTGGDSSLYQKYLDAKAAADKAAADAAETESDKTDSSVFDGSFDNSTAYGDQSKDFEFGTRFQSFFNEMKSTSLFSLPNQFLGDIPSSSTSSMTIQGGRFGSFTYDFAQFNGLFVVIKSILLVLFSWVSARIVMLKGGGG